MSKPTWTFTAYYRTRNGITQYTSGYRSKEEIKKTIAEHKKRPEEKDRPIMPVEPWVFDSFRDWLMSGERIKRIRIDINNKG